MKYVKKHRPRQDSKHAAPPPSPTTNQETTMARRKSAHVHDAITRLASLYEYGELQAETTPAAFLQSVADDVEQLRARVSELSEALRPFANFARFDRSDETLSGVLAYSYKGKMYRLTGAHLQRAAVVVRSRSRAKSAPRKLRKP
jgi:hypothetical protein